MYIKDLNKEKEKARPRRLSLKNSRKEGSPSEEPETGTPVT